MNENLLMHYATEHYELRVKAEERAWRKRHLIETATADEREERPRLVRRLLHNLGALFVHGGEWLQERFCIEPACA